MKLDWTLTLGERTFTIAHLTAGDAALVQRLTGDGWRSLDPNAGPEHCANLLAVLVARADGRDLDDVMKSITGMATLDLMGTLVSPKADVPVGE